jgi:hypothetical protein
VLFGGLGPSGPNLQFPEKFLQRTAIDRLTQYAAEQRDMIRYPTFEERGWQIGSGPTEAPCKTTTSRVKGRGRRSDRLNAEAMMALASTARQQHVEPALVNTSKTRRRVGSSRRANIPPQFTLPECTRWRFVLVLRDGLSSVVRAFSFSHASQQRTEHHQG